MAYLLALGSAALYGAADFLGGLASRQTNTITIVVTSQGAGLALLLLILPLLPLATPTVRDLIWGGTAGLAGGTGVALLYRALAVGRMTVVAPTTAVCAVIIPVAAGGPPGRGRDRARAAELREGGVRMNPVTGLSPKKINSSAAVWAPTPKPSRRVGDVSVVRRARCWSCIAISSVRAIQRRASARRACLADAVSVSMGPGRSAAQRVSRP